MIWHPLVWSFWAAAASGSLLYALAAMRSMDVVANWAPMQADAGQLRRERHAESAALLGQGSMACLVVAAVMGLIGIAMVWHRIIPGAMCGTGVLQAMGIVGPRAMFFWGLTITLLYGWWVMNGLDDHHPQGVLIPTSARLLVTAAPFLALALVHSWQALMRVDGAPPVSCCAAVYDQVLDDASTSTIMARLTPAAVWGSLVGGVGLSTAALSIATRIPGRRLGATIAAMAIAWSMLGAVCVKHVWSAYYYEVLSHPCPWCLFLADYHGAGFFIFACLAAVSLEGVAFWVADHVYGTHPVLARPADRRRRTAAWRILAGFTAFTILTLGAAIAWRLRNGVWMDGSF